MAEGEEEEEGGVAAMETEAAAPAAAAGSAGIGAADLAAVLGNILSGGIAGGGASLQQRRLQHALDVGPGLGAVLSSEALAPLLRSDPELVARLAPYLPEEHRSAEAVVGLVSTPQFRHQLDLLTHALQTGQLDTRQFGLPPGGFGVADFLKSIQAHADSERQKQQGQQGGDGAGAAHQPTLQRKAGICCWQRPVHGYCPACGAAPLTEEELFSVRRPGRRSTRDANDPRNRPENLVTLEFLQLHIVQAEMSLRDIGAFHGYTISTLSRRAKQAGVPVGRLTRASNADDGAPGGQQPSPSRPAAKRQPQALSRLQHSSGDVSAVEQEVGDGEPGACSGAAGGAAEQRPPKRQRRSTQKAQQAAELAVPLLLSIPLFDPSSMAPLLPPTSVGGEAAGGSLGGAQAEALHLWQPSAEQLDFWQAAQAAAAASVQHTVGAAGGDGQPVPFWEPFPALPPLPEAQQSPQQLRKVKAAAAGAAGGVPRRRPPLPHEAQQPRVCTNCGMDGNTAWRRHPATGDRLCSACRLYMDTHDGQMRPVGLAQEQHAAAAGGVSDGEDDHDVAEGLLSLRHRSHDVSAATTAAPQGAASEACTDGAAAAAAAEEGEAAVASQAAPAAQQAARPPVAGERQRLPTPDLDDPAGFDEAAPAARAAAPPAAWESAGCLPSRGAVPQASWVVPTAGPAGQRKRYGTPDLDGMDADEGAGQRRWSASPDLDADADADASLGVLGAAVAAGHGAAAASLRVLPPPPQALLAGSTVRSAAAPAASARQQQPQLSHASSSRAQPALLPAAKAEQQPQPAEQLVQLSAGEGEQQQEQPAAPQAVKAEEQAEEEQQQQQQQAAMPGEREQQVQAGVPAPAPAVKAEPQPQPQAALEPAAEERWRSKRQLPSQQQEKHQAAQQPAAGDGVEHSRTNLGLPSQPVSGLQPSRTTLAAGDDDASAAAAATQLPPMLGSQQAESPGPAALHAAAVGGGAALAGGGAGKALTPQFELVESVAVQSVLQQAVRFMEAADVASSESMLRPLRRLLLAGQGGKTLQDIVGGWGGYSLPTQQEIFHTAVLLARQAQWEALEGELRVVLEMAGG
ncbi:regulatory particle non-ATPase [Micractinium conductrix]|uniref:Regulatory particle non-ATPase n=1 Tax=Micractinium conductrix TaxID=554055 RepID=A0A2P6V5E8_9CHLO|nr:regulatory particle non-ATPase [Micractinium conductrix]|eukprot:PSC69302.1 regulatory particle non-ATPase [Micractinium conductrix]